MPIFSFYQQNYKSEARFAIQFLPKIAPKERNKEKLHQFSVSIWLAMQGGRMLKMLKAL